MSDSIPCSEVLAEAEHLGLSTAEACNALRLALNNTRLALWARRIDTLYATTETLASNRPVSFNRVQPLEYQAVPYWNLPVSDEDGFGYSEDESRHITMITLWREDTFQFDEQLGEGPFCSRLWDIHFNRNQALRVIKAAFSDAGRGGMSEEGQARGGGRKPMMDYATCRRAVFEQVCANPGSFSGEDGRIRQNSNRPQQNSVIRAARGWCEKHLVDLDPPSDDTLRRKVAAPMEPHLRVAGFRTWRT